MIYALRPNERRVKPGRKRRVRSFRKCDPERLIEDVQSAPWSVIDTFDSMEDKWEHWKATFLDIVNTHAPTIDVRTRRNSIKWINSDIRCEPETIISRNSVSDVILVIGSASVNLREMLKKV